MNDLGVAEIGDRNRAGTLEITDTNWDHNGTLKVTVRELWGHGDAPKGVVRMARRLARTALMYPEETRKSPLIRRWESGGCEHFTFAVSRND